MFFLKKKTTYNLERAVKIFKGKETSLVLLHTDQWSADTSTWLVAAAFRLRGPWDLIITPWSDYSLIQQILYAATKMEED